MKLVASMIVRNELARYVVEAVSALLGFCDEIRIVDDASTDGTYDALRRRFDERVRVKRNPAPMFEENEGIARQALLDWTLAAEPSHVLAIDADEFVSDPHTLRLRIVEEPDVDVWSLLVCEVWKLEADRLWIRVDGGWRPLFAPVLWRVPEVLDDDFRIPPRQLACGREPFAVSSAHIQGWSVAMDVSLLHLGWTNEATRAERIARYMKIDGGEFHAREHLESVEDVDGLTLQAMSRSAGLARLPDRI